MGPLPQSGNQSPARAVPLTPIRRLLRQLKSLDLFFLWESAGVIRTIAFCHPAPSRTSLGLQILA